MSSIRAPSSSAITCASVVSSPWPCEATPKLPVTAPVELRRIVAVSVPVLIGIPGAAGRIMATVIPGSSQSNRDRAELVALRRLGTVEDCAKVVEFLATDLSDYVTGTVIPIDGIGEGIAELEATLHSAQLSPGPFTGGC